MIPKERIEEIEKEIMYNTITDEPVRVDRETFFALLTPVLVLKKKVNPILDAIDTDSTYLEFVFYNKYPVALVIAGEDTLIGSEGVIFIADYKLQEIAGYSTAIEFKDNARNIKTLEQVIEESETDDINWPQYIKRIVENA